MKAPTREQEKNDMIVNVLKPQYAHFIDFPRGNDKNSCLEGTGSLLFDTENKKVYCNM